MSHATLGPFKGLILSSSHPPPSGSGPHFIDKALRGEDVIDPRACSQDLNPGFSDTQVHAVTTGQNGDRGERVPEAGGDGSGSSFTLWAGGGTALQSGRSGLGGL